LNIRLPVKSLLELTQARLADITSPVTEPSDMD
jgi:hypothetical protein